MLSNKTVLIIGGYGLVGRAICRELIRHNAHTLIVTSLLETEANEAVESLRREFPQASTRLVPQWGNIFVRADLKDMPRAEVLATPQYREQIYQDVLERRTPELVQSSFLVQLITGTTPEYPGLVPNIVIDAVNTATALAYQDIYHSAAEVHDLYEQVEMVWQENKWASVQRLLISLYIPQLVRHIQLLDAALRQAGVETYLKIGTSGTGGMGLNIPYTHGEEKPSRVLLSKAALAGAQTSLLFLMARTPNGPAIKEIKPTAAITWKDIGYGPIKKRGRPISLLDCPPEAGVKLEPGSRFNLNQHPAAQPGDDVLESVFIDTGENGLFSVGEFTAITTLGQMEAVTPEDIAFNVLHEIRGVNTGRDMISAMDSAVLGPTYRAGFLRHRAIQFARRLEADHNVSSVAFEILGPPKLSKLLFEAYLLKKLYRTMEGVATTSHAALMADVSRLIATDRHLRRQAISIGIPILMPNGDTLLCVNRGAGEHRWERTGWDVTPESIELWAETEWIDLRPQNMARWQKRMRLILEEITALPQPSQDASSQYPRSMTNPATWQLDNEINIGEVAGWIFNYEEQGQRMKG
jgi:NAD(P)-dependent dehydrogenase (short-subunit alcohol dehydrogenase family)